MGLPKARNPGRYVIVFVEEMEAWGFVSVVLARHRIEGAAQVPPGG
ncbi:MAG: hypothetical protein M3Q12_08055 [Pseudomonadota bacterium]|nr:hypothetical protein [Polaromonas sp.]MBA3592416.1 hypothetical protein [Polaromonas sp.]MDQ3272104.1 hypothetical protein [Pseudomonadota bacterium]